MPAPKRKLEQSAANGSIDWLGQLLQMDSALEDGFQIEADPPRSRGASPDPPNCSCEKCNIEAEPFWDLGKLEGMLGDDYDFAPELDELLKDPLLGDASGFERLMNKEVTEEPKPAEGQSSASTADHHIDGPAVESRSPQHSTGAVAWDASTGQANSEPSALSSGVLREGEAADGAEQGTSTSSKSPTPSNEGSGEEEKRKKARMMRNRESASLSRQRKKMQIEEKESQVQELQRHCASLNAAAVHLSQENAVLRQHLASMCQQTGQPFPTALLAHPPVLPFNGVKPGLAMHPGVTAAPLQKVAIARMDAPRPAPAVETGKLPVTQPKKPTKRRRQAVAGGSTALAALFCLFIYCGMGVPRVGVPLRDLKQPVILQPRALTSSSDSSLKELQPNSRSLQAAIMEEGMQEESGSNFDNVSYSEVILNPKDSALEERALRHLKDIAPFAVLSTYDTLTERYTAPAPWKSFEALASSALLPDGIAGPAMCKPVFDFDMAKIDSPQAAKQQLQQYLATMDLFKGRYRAVPLPPVSTTIPAIDEHLVGEDSSGRSEMSCGDESDYIISVLLPTKEQADAGLTQLDNMYVVVLKPNKRYAMYSCALPRSIFV